MQKMKGPSGLASRFGSSAGGPGGSGGAAVLRGIVADGESSEAEAPPRFPELVLVRAHRNRLWCG